VRQDLRHDEYRHGAQREAVDRRAGAPSLLSERDEQDPGRESENGQRHGCCERRHGLREIAKEGFASAEESTMAAVIAIELRYFFASASDELKL
jgi:hypothetical protein